MDNQTKAKITALYYSCKAIIKEGCTEYDIDSNVIEDTASGRYGYKVMLTPLSQITDEDAIEVAKIVNGMRGQKYRYTIIPPPRGMHKDVKYVLVEMYSPLVYLWFKMSVIQIDTDEGDVICGTYNNDVLRDDSTDNYIHVVDYLRSKGYAIPAFGYSIDGLVKEGVFQLSAATATKQEK
jgi:septum formation inhibitor-activating ATPase MinD